LTNTWLETRMAKHYSSHVTWQRWDQIESRFPYEWPSVKIQVDPTINSFTTNIHTKSHFCQQRNHSHNTLYPFKKHTNPITYLWCKSDKALQKKIPLNEPKWSLNLPSRIKKKNCMYLSKQEPKKTTSHMLLSVNDGKLKANCLTNELRPMVMSIYLIYYLCMHKMPLS